MDLLFVTHLLNGLLMVGMPVALAVFLSRRFGLGWRLWWIGAATFVLSQVGHIPFNWILTRAFQVGALPAVPTGWRPYFNPIVLGLSAGLWEELTRAGVFRWWASEARSWRKAVMLGAGHGGIEAIIFGLLVLYTFVQMAALRNADLSQVLPPAQIELAQQQMNSYWTLPWPMTLLGALERLFTIPTQIALAVLVLQAFTRRQPGWVALAVLYHAAVDAVVVYFSAAWGQRPGGAYAIEAIVGVFALVSLAIIFSFRRAEPAEPGAPAQPVTQAPAAPLTAADIEPAELSVTRDKLDQSRYL